MASAYVACFQDGWERIHDQQATVMLIDHLSELEASRLIMVYATKKVWLQ